MNAACGRNAVNVCVGLRTAEAEEVTVRAVEVPGGNSLVCVDESSDVAAVVRVVIGMGATVADSEQAVVAPS